MDTKEIVQCAAQIERFHTERRYGSVMTLLSHLEKAGVTAEQLETTDLAKTLYKLMKTCSDHRVKRAVRSLLSKWKREYSRVRKGEAAEASEPGDGDKEEESLQGKPGLQTALDSTRAKCIQLLLAAINPEPPDQDRAAQLARDVEQHIHQLHTASRVRYKACVRSKVANLRNPKNCHLRQGLLSGSLPPETFAQMSAEEMAGAELRRLREQYSSQGVSERQLPQGVEGTPTHKIHCKRCGGSDCRVTQVFRGALFLPAWVRRGGPDEDAMTFVTCSGCGQQWYHSGWVCL